MNNDDENVVYMGETDSRNRRLRFGIKKKDRSRHLYAIGKTGMGKSTLLENLAVQDILNGDGLCFMDPHGKSADLLLEYVPEHRIKDVIYFAPFDMDYPVSFNVMEDVGPERRYLVASGLMASFKKIWVDAWSARMEYILGNIMLALLEYPGSTLVGVNRMLTDKDYRKEVVNNISDPSVRSFWVNEYANYTDKFAAEAAPAIQNKVGQFVANPLIRNIIGQANSSFDIREVMDNKKILIINLSKGRVGEANANLLGSMLITKIYLGAMSRADLSEKDLAAAPNFYFYVDEFQSFANESFADILSEARKYKLNLHIAHQYIEQMTDEVRAAVFGNVGTMCIFRVGATDAEAIEKEFAPVFTAEEIVNLQKYQMYLKLMIDGVTSSPFSAAGLAPYPKPERSYVREIIDASRAQYARPREVVQEEIRSWHEINFAKLGGSGGQGGSTGGNQGGGQGGQGSGSQVSQKGNSLQGNAFGSQRSGQRSGGDSPQSAQPGYQSQSGSQSSSSQPSRQSSPQPSYQASSQGGPQGGSFQPRNSSISPQGSTQGGAPRSVSGGGSSYGASNVGQQQNQGQSGQFGQNSQGGPATTGGYQGQQGSREGSRGPQQYQDQGRRDRAPGPSSGYQGPGTQRTPRSEDNNKRGEDQRRMDDANRKENEFRKAISLNYLKSEQSEQKNNDHKGAKPENVAALREALLSVMQSTGVVVSQPASSETPSPAAAASVMTPAQTQASVSAPTTGASVPERVSGQAAMPASSPSVASDVSTSAPVSAQRPTASSYTTSHGHADNSQPSSHLSQHASQSSSQHPSRSDQRGNAEQRHDSHRASNQRPHQGHSRHDSSQNGSHQGSQRGSRQGAEPRRIDSGQPYAHSSQTLDANGARESAGMVADSNNHGRQPKQGGVSEVDTQSLEHLFKD